MGTVFIIVIMSCDTAAARRWWRALPLQSSTNFDCATSYQSNIMQLRTTSTM